VKKGHVIFVPWPDTPITTSHPDQGTESLVTLELKSWDRDASRMPTSEEAHHLSLAKPETPQKVGGYNSVGGIQIHCVFDFFFRGCSFSMFERATTGEQKHVNAIQGHAAFDPSSMVQFG